MPRAILIADDDRLVGEIVEHKLRRQGYRPRVVGDGEQALSAIVEDPPDLVILDAMMPVRDGFDVLRQLKNDPALAGIPVIMLTARKEDRDIVAALELGATDYLVKPFSPDELVARIGRILGPAGAR